MMSKSIISVMLLLCLVTSVQAKSPNILWIMSDDMRPQLGCYGDKDVRSPHLDAFAQTALRFENAYVQSAICSPSRNSMLSGMRPNTTGLRGFGVHLRDVVPTVVTLPQHFKQNGYESRAFGKIYHIYVESMLGNEDDAKSWSEPQQLPTVPVWGPEQNALRNRLIEEAKAAGVVFDHPHRWPSRPQHSNDRLPLHGVARQEQSAPATRALRSPKR